MAQNAEHGCAEDEPNPLLGDHERPHPLGPAGRFRWVCGASVGLPAGPVEEAPGRTGTDSAEPGDRAGAIRPVEPADHPEAAHRPDPEHPDGAHSHPDGARSGGPLDGAVKVTGPDETDQVTEVTEAVRGGERSRLIPRPRRGEPDDVDAPEPLCGMAERAESATGLTGPADGAGAAPDDGVAEAGPPGTSSCRTDRPGWAGAHRHGAVRPTRRAVRRDRPPRRWC